MLGTLRRNSGPAVEKARTDWREHGSLASRGPETLWVLKLHPVQHHGHMLGEALLELLMPALYYKDARVYISSSIPRNREALRGHDSGISSQHDCP